MFIYFPGIHIYNQLDPMVALISELEADGLVMPNYGESVLELSRQLDRGSGDLIGDNQKKVFMLIDGLGYNLIKGIMERGEVKSELLSKSTMKRITSVFPTITPNVLSSVYSGMTPAEHGVLGMEMPLKGAGSIVHVFKWTPVFKHDAKMNIDPCELFPRSQIIERLASKKNLASLCDEQFINSPVTKAIMNCERVPFISFDDMLVKLSRLTDEGKHDYIYVYYDAVDHMSHEYSPVSKEVEEEIKGMLLSIDRILLKSLKKNGYDLVITADHGQTVVTEKEMIRIGPKSEIMKFLSMPPWCEKRVRVADVLPGKEKQFEDCFAKTYGKYGYLIESEEAIRSGIFGANMVPEDRRHLFGTHIMLSKFNYAFMFDYLGLDQRVRPVSGQHGGLSPDEMYIPAILY